MNLAELGFKETDCDLEYSRVEKYSRDYKIAVVLWNNKPKSLIWFAWSPIEKEWVTIRTWFGDLDTVMGELLWYVQTPEERLIRVN